MKSPDRFLASHWQKRPLMMNAASFSGPALSVNEAAWLATQSDVESRLVFTEHGDGSPTYRLEHGPFSESDLSGLPGENWTLLIQDVDKHLPEFREWFRAIRFIPDWRIDDLMISVAAPGGSVGPHIDNYDVFLVQVAGTRNWRTGDPALAAPDQSSAGLSLLKPFDTVSHWLARPGDVLYLPPGIPHWGVAAELCTTYSIGMRAPTRIELMAGADRVLGRTIEENETDDVFYDDSDLSVCEAQPGEIPRSALRRVASQELLFDDLNDHDLARVLGAVVTDPKAWLMPEPIQESEWPTGIHGMARLAWSAVDDSSLIFVNGADRSVSHEALAVFQRWCASRTVSDADMDHLRASPDGDACIEWLRLQGTFDAGHSEE